jgi:hypothetical protein
MVGRLVEDLPADRKSAMVTVFQEGQRIRFAADVNDHDGPETTIRAISGNRLTLDPFHATASIPAGTWVLSHGDDDVNGASLVSAIAAETVVETVEVDGYDLLDATVPIALGERLRVPPSHLVYSAEHTIRASQD